MVSSLALLLLHISVLLLLVVGTVNGDGFVDSETQQLPAGITKLYAEQVIEDALTRVLTRLQETHLEEQKRRQRKLQTGGQSEWAQMVGEDIEDTDAEQAPNECNTILYTASAKELREEAFASMQQLPFLNDVEVKLIDLFILARIKYDLQVWKLCGRCSDFGPGEVACRKQDYGYEANHSGLFIAPYDTQAKQFFKGTIPVNFYAPAAGVVPSEAHFPTKDPQLLIAAYITATSGAASVVIDYIGVGESKDYYRAFLNYQSIVTATVPLLWQAEQIVAKQSNCASALADSVVVFGYSEGGYASVAIADALFLMGKEILAMHAGGAPYRVSTTSMLTLVEKILNGDNDPAFFIALLAAGLSSSNGDAANYGTGQDFLAPHIREEMIEQVQISNHIDRKGVDDVIGIWSPDHPDPPPEEVLAIINPAFRDLVQPAVQIGEKAPCITSVNPSVDKLCEALQNADVVQILEEASYPMYLCHSIEDNLVPYRNVPDLSANPYLSLKTVKGRHTPAAVPCAINSLAWYLNPINLKWHKIKNKTSRHGCAHRRMEKQEEDGIHMLRKH